MRVVTMRQHPNTKNDINHRDISQNIHNFDSKANKNSESIYQPPVSTSHSTVGSTYNGRAGSVNTNETVPMKDSSIYNVGGVYCIGNKASQNLKDFIHSFHQFGAKSAPSGIAVKRRKAGFASCDIKGAGYLSLVDVESFVWSKLKLDHGETKGSRIYDTFTPSLHLAYEATKVLKKKHETTAQQKSQQENDGISFQFFRILNVYLCIYAGMLDSFYLIAGKSSKNRSGIGIANLLLTKEQWMSGYVHLGNRGFVFPPVQETAEAAFNVMCFISQTKSGPFVDFHAFCDWIVGFEIKSYTPLGEFLNGTADFLTEARSVRSSSSRVTASTATTSKSFSSSSFSKTSVPSISNTIKETSSSIPALKERDRKNHPENEHFSNTKSNSIAEVRDYIQKNVTSEKKRQEERLNSLRLGDKSSVPNTPEEKKDDSSTPTVPLRSYPRYTTRRRNRSVSNDKRPHNSSLTLLNMMRQSFVIPKMTKSKIATQDAVRELSLSARMALQDFSEHLKVLQKETLDEDMFNILLDDMGYKRDRSGLFDNLLEEIREINPTKSAKREISADDMLCLYISDPYHILDSGKDTGSALMKYIDKLFQEVTNDGKGGMDKEEAGLLIERLIARKPSKEEVDALFHVLDANSSGIVNRIQFKNWVVKPNANNDMGIPSELLYIIFIMIIAKLWNTNITIMSSSKLQSHISRSCSSDIRTIRGRT